MEKHLEETVVEAHYEDMPMFTPEEIAILKKAVQKQKANQTSGETVGRRLNELYDKLVSIQYQYDSIKRVCGDFSKELEEQKVSLDGIHSAMGDLINLITRVDKIEERLGGKK